MGLRNFLDKKLGIRFDSHTLGNLAKNAAPAVAFTPAGVLGAGALGLAGGLGRGEKLGSAVKSGIGSAAMGGGLASVAGKLGVGSGARLGFGIGGGGGAPAASAATSAPPAPVPHGGLALPSQPDLLTTATKAVDPRNIASKAVGAGKGLLGFAEAHPNAAAGALQGLGSIVGSGAENRTENARADLLEQQAGESRYDFERRKRREAELAPVWGALGTSIGDSFNSPAKNPYLPGA